MASDSADAEPAADADVEVDVHADVKADVHADATSDARPEDEADVDVEAQEEAYEELAHESVEELVEEEAAEEAAEERDAGEEPGEEEPPDPRLLRAADRCTAALANGALDAVDALAVPYLGESGWTQLQETWRQENCRVLAPAARQALRSPSRLHDAAGQLAGQVWAWLGRPWVEQMMVRELVKRLPIVGEGQVRPLARAAQLAGMRLCLARGHELTACPCFVDVVKEEGERQPRRLLDAAPGGLPALAKLR